LALSISDKGTKAEIITRIEDHFKAHPGLQLNSRFSGLFNKPGSHHAIASQSKDTSALANEVTNGGDSLGEPESDLNEATALFNHTSTLHAHPHHYSYPGNYSTYPAFNLSEAHLQNSQPQAGPSTLQPYSYPFQGHQPFI